MSVPGLHPDVPVHGACAGVRHRQAIAGASHDVPSDYVGIRRVDRTSQVATGAAGPARSRYRPRILEEIVEMRTLLAFIFVLNLLLVACGPETRHVFTSEEAIDSHLEGELPLGMDKEAVRDRLAKMGATIIAERDTGFYSSSNEIRCSSHFRVSLSSYRIVFDVDVIAHIGFDADDRVCDVEVLKHTDAL